MQSISFLSFNSYNHLIPSQKPSVKNSQSSSIAKDNKDIYDKQERLQVTDPILKVIINRIKTAQLPYNKKKFLLKSVWQILKHSTNDKTIDIKKEIFLLIERLEAAEKQKNYTKNIEEDSKKIDFLVEKLLIQDKKEYLTNKLYQKTSQLTQKIEKLAPEKNKNSES